MTDERQPPEPADQVEDLDVPEDERDDVKGGIQDGTSNTVMMRACATGKHYPEVVIE